ncbi:fungal specific transcription factor domain-containing protein [Sarocladium implicatum]|nr:fungal specific transcription factor domain-containing protein [Sarocladium implicatum]
MVNHLEQPGAAHRQELLQPVNDDISPSATNPAITEQSYNPRGGPDNDDDSSPLILARAIEPLSPQRRLLFQHFSDFIAAKMVVYDFGGNGYRDIILPLACQDEVVGQAVCAVAAFHLGSNGLVSDMVQTAEATQHAVVARLSRDARELAPNRVFTMSTWAAIMVLLVGETITAHSNFIQLLGMLRPLAKSAHLYHSMPQEAISFLQQQTRMFQLFSSAFDSNGDSLKLLSGPIEPYLDWATLPDDSTNDTRLANMLTIRSAILASAHLCAQRMQNPSSYVCPAQELETLKQTVISLEPNVDGAHALVWTCFIAAAESTLPEHRSFFSRRLASLFECTRFGTIPKALELLDTIWKKQGKTKWTELVPLERPMLVM